MRRRKLWRRSKKICVLSKIEEALRYGWDEAKSRSRRFSKPRMLPDTMFLLRRCAKIDDTERSDVHWSFLRPITRRSEHCWTLKSESDCRYGARLSLCDEADAAGPSRWRKQPLPTCAGCIAGWDDRCRDCAGDAMRYVAISQVL
ncbi:hypothetical protein KCP71_16355 [Salmonella enterica subsp. enterica]|nr:hypothetical protein KCP71_16355 [Salmonella enterica subsp. enterica]